MKRYTEYKDSGVPWIGKIPGHWEVEIIKHLFLERSEKGHPNEPILCSTQKYGVIPQNIYENRVVVVNKGLEGLKLVKVGDYVISLRSFQGGIEYAHYGGIISAAYTVLKPKQDNDSRYFRYLFKSQPFIELLKTCVTGIREGQNINYGLLKKNKLAIPPLAEQEKIVAFLDKQTNLIESCICLRERELQTLNELKQAKIASAVTRGLNPDVPMKDSGIPWIGMIPAHWEIAQLRKYLRLVSEKNHPEETLLSVTREQGVIIRNTDSKEENHNYIPDDLSGYKLVKKGQFVINKMKSWQGSYAVSKYQGIVSPAYYVCDLNFPDKDFFSIAIRSQAYIGFFTQLSKGIRVGQWDLSTIALKSVPFFEPPIEEQHQIVEYIKQTITSIDFYITSLEKEIEYLKEYKQRLISDVVTGKVDVRDEA
ncbi:MAG: restriction endonuclease subunit S [Bacteroidales bacterium]|nr:restriction endonuclease subunit S [Bacteroidales bacterium]